MRRTLARASPRTDLPQLVLGKRVVENCPFGKIPVRNGAIAAKPLVAENPGKTVVCDARRPRLSIQSRGEGAGHRMPGGQSRWSQGKDLSWEPLRPELVVEVAYEHMQGTRFRHMAQFRRWRSDKKPSDCTYAQLEVVPAQELMAIFAGGR